MNYAYYDRSYRLRHNKTQVRVDRAAYAGFDVGLIGSLVTGAGVSPLHASAAGLAAGTILGALYNMAASEKSQ